MYKNTYFSLSVIVSLMALIGIITLEIIFPSFPSIKKVFHANMPLLQFNTIFYLVGYGFSQIIYGPLSDHYGRKPILLIGSSIYILGGMTCLFSLHIEMLIFGRFIQGLGVGACALLSRVILRDCFEEADMAKRMSIISAVVIAGGSLAPAIGGIIEDAFTYKGNFMFMVGSGIFLFIILSLFLPETRKQKREKLDLKSIVKAYKDIAKNKEFLCYMVLSSFVLTIIIIAPVYAVFFLQNSLGYSSSWAGILIAIFALGEFTGSLLNTYLLKKISINKMIYMGFLLFGLGGEMLLLLNIKENSLMGILLPFTLVSIGIGLIFGNSIAGAYSKFKENIGIGGSIFGFLQILLTTNMSFGFSLFEDMTPGCFSSLLILISLSGVFVLYILRRQRPLKIESYV